MDSIRAPLIVSVLIVAGMAAVSAWVWPMIPDGARVAVHFDAAGNANGYASKFWALALLPLMASALTGLFAVLPFTGRMAGNRSLPGNPAWIAGWLGSLMVLAIAHGMIVLLARGVLINVAGNMNFLLALLWIVVGNFLGKTQPNNYVGVRTRWTMTSDYSWQQSNRLCGWMLVGIGLLELGALAMGVDRRWATFGMVAALLAMAAILIPLSRYYWQHDPDRENADRR
jgi:uncharacterized membrane protein